MEDLGVSLKEFGLYQGVIAAFFAATSLSSSYFIKRFGTKKCFFVSCYLIIVFFVMVLWITIFNIKDPIVITLAMLFQAVGMAYPVNIFYPLALESVNDAKSRIGALLVSFRIFISAIIIGLASYFYDGSFFTAGLSICITLGISCVTCYLLFKVYRILE
jgi:DHA1 family bicyclomycin/chloramphenicol resistance-like MFS transporter